MSWAVITGDCVEQMRQLDEGSIDAIVCDPPYGLEFMGREWDRLDGTVLHDPSEVGGFQDGAGGNPYSRSRIRYGRGTGEKELAHRSFKRSGNNAPRFGAWTPTASPEGIEKVANGNRAMQDWHYAWAVEALRVLKPGGHLLAFGGTRTYHRLACAVEDAGFELRDSIMWIYGSGFPKSLDVSKAIDKAARGVPQGGADPTSPNHGQYKTQATEGKRDEGDAGRGYGAGPGQFMKPGDIDPKTGRKIIGYRESSSYPDSDGVAMYRNRSASEGTQVNTGGMPLVTAPATPEAEEWDGWGTALKPAHEPIVVARKPLGGTVAGNVLKHGTGALNIDGCRIATDWQVDRGESWLRGGRQATSDGEWQGPSVKAEGSTVADRVSSDGRWPSNLVLSHSPGCRQVGTRHVRAITGRSAGDPDGHGIYGKSFPRGDKRPTGKGDEDGMETVEAWECVDGCPVKALDEQTGVLRSGEGAVRKESGSDRQGNTSPAFGAESRPAGTPMVTYGDEGGASRFFPTFNGRDGEASAERTYEAQGATDFAAKPGARREAAVASERFPTFDGAPFRYQAKPSTAEREAGLSELDEQAFGQSCGAQAAMARGEDSYQGEDSSTGLNRIKQRRNIHPTCKGVDLMRWLVRLVTPPGGTVLDPFLGSGTTGCAAVLEGFEFIGIEREAEYVQIAEARIAFWAQHPTELPVEQALAAERERSRHRDSGQLDIFGELASG